MTPAEFEGQMAGYRKRQEREWERAAWIVHHGYAPHMKRGKRPPSPDKLLGRVKSGSRGRDE